MTERVLDRIIALPDLPPRSAEAHKGTFGRVLIVAGSRGMTGAASLSATAALRGGAGLVTVATPLSVQPIVAGYEPSYLTLGLPDDNEGLLSRAALPQLMDVLSRQTAAAWGPGLGRSDDLDDVTLTVYKSAALPMVFDADGLNALAHRRDWMSGPAPGGPRILTPHPGEFARLTGFDPAAIADHREETAADFAAQHGVVVLLKGPQTVITDGQRVALNPTGNSGTATGGTGDVLTGLIASMLGQQMAPFDAAQLAAYLHGLAGDIAAAELSNPGLIASDLPKFLARAWRHFGR
jgi:ADP-dependent NAD(P)H-hydrate dehydratase